MLELREVTKLLETSETIKESPTANATSVILKRSRNHYVRVERGNETVRNFPNNKGISNCQCYICHFKPIDRALKCLKLRWPLITDFRWDGMPADYLMKK